MANRDVRMAEGPALPAGVPRLLTPEGIADPYPAYAALRDSAPVHYEPVHESWALLRYDDVYAALRDHETFSSGDSSQAAPKSRPPMVLITDDPPRHTRFRRLVNRAFTPRRVAELEPWIAEVVGALLDEVEGEVEFVDQFARPLPTQVIATLLGIPTSEGETFNRWTDAYLGSEAAFPRPVKRAETFAMAEYFGRLVAERRAAASGDLITALASAEFEGEELEGERLAEWEVVGFLILLLVAGNETTRNLLGNMLWLLAERPALWAEARESRALVEPIIEETLRYQSPVQVLFRRTTRAVEMSGVQIPEGARVSVWFGSANRDATGFPDPDAFRVDRELSQHLAFSTGVHFCLGAPLARAEARLTLNALLDRYARVELGAGEPVRQREVPVTFGFSKLPLRLFPA